MKLSIVIPTYNEEGNISETVTVLYNVMEKEKIDHEIVVVNDNSKDNTAQILKELKSSIPSLSF